MRQAYILGLHTDFMLLHDQLQVRSVLVLVLVLPVIICDGLGYRRRVFLFFTWCARGFHAASWAVAGTLRLVYSLEGGAVNRWGEGGKEAGNLEHVLIRVVTYMVACMV